MPQKPHKMTTLVKTFQLSFSVTGASSAIAGKEALSKLQPTLPCPTCTRILSNSQQKQVGQVSGMTVHQQNNKSEIKSHRMTKIS